MVSSGKALPDLASLAHDFGLLASSSKPLQISQLQTKDHYQSIFPSRTWLQMALFNNIQGRLGLGIPKLTSLFLELQS